MENAQQSWSAVHFGDELSAGPALAAAGPAVFASVVAVTRFAVGARTSGHTVAVLVVGAAAAAAVIQARWRTTRDDCPANRVGV